jgi:G3E family GTPase
MASAIPMTVLTGYLGSGKTTLLKRLLADPKMAGTGVIINEFGDVGLDHTLVESAQEETVLLPSGCVCCQVRGDLKEALARLHRQSLHGEIPPLKRVVLETTGLADPTPIIHTLMTDEDTFRIYQLDGVVTTVDGELGMGQLDTAFEPAKQVALADRLIVTKSDRADAAALAALEARLKGLNRSADVLKVVKGDVDPERLFGLGAHEPSISGADARQWLSLETHTDPAAGSDAHHSHSHHHGHHQHGHHHHDHTCGPECGHDHHGHHHDPAHLHGVASFALIYDGELDGNGLSLGLQTLAGSYGDKLLRVKGIVTVAGQRKPFVVHGVQHIFYPPDTLAEWPAGADGKPDKRSRFVFITKDLDRAVIVRHLKPFIGEPQA